MGWIFPCTANNFGTRATVLQPMAANTFLVSEKENGLSVKLTYHPGSVPSGQFEEILGARTSSVPFSGVISSISRLMLLRKGTNRRGYNSWSHCK